MSDILLPITTYSKSYVFVDGVRFDFCLDYVTKHLDVYVDTNDPFYSIPDSIDKFVSGFQGISISYYFLLGSYSRF